MLGTKVTRPSHRDLPVEIFDDFFTTETADEIRSRMEQPRWSFTGGRPPNSFWHMDGLEHDDYFRDHLFGLICNRLGRTFRILRVYANGQVTSAHANHRAPTMHCHVTPTVIPPLPQTALQCGSPHVDDGDVTFLYYPNPTWRSSWGGGLRFVRSPHKTLQSRRKAGDVIRYVPNRALLFPASLVHYAEAPTKHFAGLRVSLAYKLLNR